MKITFEIDNEIINQTFRQAHSRYWCSDFDWNGKTGYVLEHNKEDDKKPKRHRLSQKSVKVGIANLAKHAPRIFGKLLANELDGPQSDIVLQYCAGVVWEHDGRIDNKYG